MSGLKGIVTHYVKNNDDIRSVSFYCTVTCIKIKEIILWVEFHQRAKHNFDGVLSERNRLLLYFTDESKTDKGTGLFCFNSKVVIFRILDVCSPFTTELIAIENSLDCEYMWKRLKIFQQIFVHR